MVQPLETAIKQDLINQVIEKLDSSEEKMERVLRFLIKGRADLSETCTTVIKCHDMPTVVKLLIDKGLDVDFVSDGATPLSRAILNDRPLVVDVLLKAGARKFDSSIFHAPNALKMFTKIVENMQGKPFDVNAKDADNNTLLHTVNGFANPEIVAFLLERGFDVNATNNDKQTVLRFAFDKIRQICLHTSDSVEACANYRVIVRLLVAGGATLDGLGLSRDLVREYFADFEFEKSLYGPDVRGTDTVIHRKIRTIKDRILEGM